MHTRIGIAFLLMGGVAALLGQNPPQTPLEQPAPSLLELYQRLFEEVFELKGQTGPAPILLNGEPTGEVRINPLSTLGLSQKEGESLAVVAADCTSQMENLRNAAASSLFEMRMRALESGESSQSQEQRLNEIVQNRTDAIVASHIEQLKTVLSQTSMDTIEKRLNSRSKERFLLNRTRPAATPDGRKIMK